MFPFQDVVSKVDNSQTACAPLPPSISLGGYVFVMQREQVAGRGPQIPQSGDHNLQLGGGSKQQTGTSPLPVKATHTPAVYPAFSRNPAVMDFKVKQILLEFLLAPLF